MNVEPSFKRILIAVDGSDIADMAVAVGVKLADALQAEITFVYVVNPALASTPEGGIPASKILQSLEEEGRAVLARATSAAGRPAQELVRRGQPSKEIMKAAQEEGAGLIVIGTHGLTGIKRVLLGSTAEDVVRHASCPVMVVRGTAVP